MSRNNFQKRANTIFTNIEMTLPISGRVFKGMRAIGSTVFMIVALIFSAQVNATCFTDALETTPTVDFVDNGDGTVTHSKTGLMWAVCTEGQSWSIGSCTGTETDFTWADALIVPTDQNALNYLGYGDWRVPNKKELASILEMSCVNPAINLAVFPDTPNKIYWTSTPNETNTSQAWRVVFLYGNLTLSPRTDTFPVRLVRDL